MSVFDGSSAERLVVNQTQRRKVVLGAAALLAAPFASFAQQPSRVWRIGFLTNGTVASAGGQLDAFRRGLNELGYVEGRNFSIESRWAEGKLDRLPGLVAELLEQKIDIMFAPSGVAAEATKKSGTTIPIVFAFAPDPVGQGFGSSLSHPGGNMTGTTSTHTELSAKRVELLKETFPAAKRIAVLYFLTPAAAGVAEQLAETERAAKILGIALVTEEAARVDDFGRAFASMQKQSPDALIVIENPIFFTNRARLAELAAAMRIPAIYNVSDYVRAGGLMSYGASYADLARRAAAYVVKILNGAKPGDLPIERPTTFELVINMKTARAIGITIPQSVLIRADETIT
jgi:putative tryptophan/tyrosine transport system substrate-binding protein